MAKKRVAIPKATSTRLLYNCAWTCCVCGKRGCQIHHIDEDPSNNTIENLVFICNDCHEKAHSDFKMSKNLKAEHLKTFKKLWEDEVTKRSSQSMIPGESPFLQSSWCYFNLNRMLSLMSAFNIDYNEHHFNRLSDAGIVNDMGIPTSFPPEGIMKSVFDYMGMMHALRCIQMYREVINSIISASNPIELLSTNRKDELMTLLNPGTLFFIEKAFYFKRNMIGDKWFNILCYTQFRSIKINFLIETKLIFSDSALITSFTGHNTAFALLLVKSINKVDKKLVIEASPISIGTGRVSFKRATPYAHLIDKNTSHVSQEYFEARYDDGSDDPWYEED